MDLRYAIADLKKDMHEHFVGFENRFLLMQIFLTSWRSAVAKLTSEPALYRTLHSSAMKGYL
jgi:hypothetical protein